MAARLAILVAGRVAETRYQHRVIDVAAWFVAAKANEPYWYDEDAESDEARAWFLIEGEADPVGLLYAAVATAESILGEQWSEVETVVDELLASEPR